ncbi:hypothetical protein U1Q18_010058 [Sarracenia purpurea var. burkii]
MMKKKMELATLCGIKACIICFGLNRVVKTWLKDPHEVRSVIEAYFSGYDKDRHGKKESSVEEEVGAVAMAMKNAIGNGGLSVSVWSDFNPFNLAILADGGSGGLRCGSGGLLVFVWFDSNLFDLVIHGGGGSGGSGGLLISVCSDSDPFDLAIHSNGFHVSVFSNSNPFDLEILDGGGSGGLHVWSDFDPSDLAVLG